MIDRYTADLWAGGVRIYSNDSGGTMFTPKHGNVGEKEKWCLSSNVTALEDSLASAVKEAESMRKVAENSVEMAQNAQDRESDMFKRGSEIEREAVVEWLKGQAKFMTLAENFGEWIDQGKHIQSAEAKEQEPDEMSEIRSIEHKLAESLSDGECMLSAAGYVADLVRAINREETKNG